MMVITRKYKSWKIKMARALLIQCNNVKNSVNYKSDRKNNLAHVYIILIDQGKFIYKKYR